MKKLIINPTEKEKILEQYDGTLKVNTQNFNRLLNGKLGNVKTIMEDVPTEPTPQSITQPNSPGSPTPSKVESSEPSEAELQSQQMELMGKMQSINSKMEEIKKTKELTEKQRLISEVQKRLNEIESYLKENCKRILFKGKLCRTFFKEQKQLSAGLMKLQGLATEIGGGSDMQYKSSDGGDGGGASGAQKVTAWTMALAGLTGLIFSIIKGIKGDDGGVSI